MAYLSTGAADTGRQNILKNILASIARGFDRWVDVMSRQDQLRALHAKSDAQLAEMGLKRENIVAYVFRDRIGM